jgi:MinD superfamily P-loop ATPase
MVICIASGKGEEGKASIATNLARHFRDEQLVRL